MSKEVMKQALGKVQEFKSRWYKVPQFANKINKATRESITLALVPVFELEHALQEALVEQPAPVQGWKLVPVLATREIEDAIGRARNLSASEIWEDALAAAPPAQPAPVQKASIPDAWTDLTAYILQDDLHNRLTPRVVDIAYSAFMSGRTGKNKDDGGHCDWFNDTKPMVMEQLAKIRKDLAAQPAQPAQPAPMSETNRVIAYAASNKLRALGYQWLNDEWSQLAPQPAQQEYTCSQGQV